MTPPATQPERHGTVTERSGDLPTLWRDRGGGWLGEASWQERRLAWARLRIPGEGELVIEPRAAEHPLLGACDRLRAGDREALAAAVDWAAPAAIPALDRPGALPAGAGTAVLSFLAWRAREAGRATLRYRGPYASAALFASLRDCFAVEGDVAAALERFTAGAETAAVAGVAREVPVGFAPHPFERVFARDEAGGEVCAQLRDGLEALWLRGRAYRRGGAVRRLRQEGERVWAEVVLGDAPWARVAAVDRRGALLEGPHPLPAATGPIGAPLPESLRGLLVAWLPSRAPRLLAPALARLLGELPMRFDDTGDEAARADDRGLAVHAALVEHIDDAGELAAAVARAVEPVAARLAQRVLAGTASSMWDRQS